MYLLLKLGIFHGYVSLLEGTLPSFQFAEIGMAEAEPAWGKDFAMQLHDLHVYIEENHDH